MTGTNDARDVTAVLPTYNRAPALEQSLPRLLAMDGIKRLVVVDDGSTDGTAAVLARHDDPRLHVLRHDVNRGLPAARNTGARNAETTWVVYLEDDCGFPDDYVDQLLDEAIASGASIVSAPWLGVYAHDVERIWAERRRGATRIFSLGTHVSTVPDGPVETPFMCALALVRKDVFATVQYDEGLRGNAWREETDFYVSAVRAGFTCVLTPRTASWQLGTWSGGARRGILRYELYTWRNNWRFLTRHEEWLVAHGHIRSARHEQLRFGWSRRRAVMGQLRGRVAAVVRTRSQSRSG
jgi:glycosyltransferase involved in cell wall biosynthesis